MYTINDLFDAVRRGNERMIAVIAREVPINSRGRLSAEDKAKCTGLGRY